MTTRTDVINYFIKYRNYRTYLEIGVYDGINFMNVDCSEKIGIDPSFAKLHTSARPYCVRMNSDEFFNSIPTDQLFDIIFIDGDHTYEQVVKDIANSKKHLSVNGVIIMHDVYVFDEKQTVYNDDSVYMGTTYQAFIQQVMMNEIKHMYNVYYTGIDLTGVIDTQLVDVTTTQYDNVANPQLVDVTTTQLVNVANPQLVNVIKQDNILDKYINIIKSYINIQGVDNIDNLYSLVAIYRLGFQDYINNQAWLYPKGSLPLCESSK